MLNESTEDDASSTDVLVHNFRGGFMEKLSLGYDELSTKYPRLIYASSSGWGDEGPCVEQGRGGHDMMARSEPGWYVHAGTDQQPIPGGISIDYPAGLLLANAILLALLARERTGRGQHVTTDLFSVALHGHVWTGAHLINLDRGQTSGGPADMEDAINRSFPTADGWIEVSPVFSSNPLRDISVGMGIGDLSENPRYGSPQLQLARRDEINALLTDHLRKKTTAECHSRTGTPSVEMICTAVNPYKISQQQAKPEEEKYYETRSRGYLVEPIRRAAYGTFGWSEVGQRVLA